MDELRRELDIAHQLNLRMEKICRISLAITKSLVNCPGDLDCTLRCIVDSARDAVGAEFAALGVGNDPEKPFKPWVHSGVDTETVAHVGRTPRPVGLLGVVAREGRPLRVDDVTKNPHFRGFPDKHPFVPRFLGAPIFDKKSIGNLYFGRLASSPPFSEMDQHVAELIASKAAIAIELAALHRKTRRAVRSRERILAIVSHDLKNPLGSIGLYTEVLDKKLPASGDPQLRGAMEGIARSTDRMKKLITDLLDISQIEDGSLRYELKSCEASQLLQNAYEIMRKIAESKAITLKVEISGQQCLKCDRDRILQVFENLIGNALKFSPSGTTVTLRFELAGDEGVFSVKDQGPGIPPDQMPLLFKRYWQAEAARRMGRGLGLAIAKGILDAHGGKIWAQSTVGQGNTFFFSVPAIRACGCSCTSNI